MTYSGPMDSNLPRLGVSACLLGQPVRYDGGHKAHDFLMRQLTGLVEWVPVCPEAEAGLGTPREPARLHVHRNAVRMVGRESGVDVTDTLDAFVAEYLDRLASMQLDGFVLKDRSPSCGTRTVPLHDDQGRVVGSTWGLFSAALARYDRRLPLVREDELDRPQLRREFLHRVLQRWRSRSGQAGLPAAGAWKPLLDPNP